MTELNELILGTIGRYIDNFINFQFSHWYIAVPMCFIEFVLICFIYFKFGCWRCDP